MKPQFIDSNMFLEYTGTDLYAALKDTDNPSAKVDSFLARVEIRVKSWVDKNTFRVREWNCLTNYQLGKFRLALLEQAYYMYRNGDIAQDSGYDQEKGLVVDNHAKQEIIICQPCIDFLIQAGLFNSTIKNRRRFMHENPMIGDGLPASRPTGSCTPVVPNPPSTGYYTKEQIDEKLDLKEDKANKVQSVDNSPEHYASTAAIRSDFYDKQQVDALIQEAQEEDYVRVDINVYPTLEDFLASTGKAGVTYLYPVDVTDLSEGYYQYIWEGDSWIMLSKTAIENLLIVTYSQLKTLRDNSKLKPGVFYRIIDYECTTSAANTASAGHVFDIIVRADDINVLNENAYACKHSGDTYFADSNLAAWRLKYCLDNDALHYEWADAYGIVINNILYARDESDDDLTKTYPYSWVNSNTHRYTSTSTPTTSDSAHSSRTGGSTYAISAINEESGKGVIYWMRDEWGNECPYDFKNILFTRANVYENAYTFTRNSNQDGSLLVGQCENNIIKEAVSGGTRKLYFNVFYTTNTYLTCLNNVIKTRCRNNTFYNNCNYNTLGNSCNNNTITNGSYNLLKNNSSDNVITSGSRNCLGAVCTGNTIIGNDNILGNYCGSNTNINDYNIFGNNCSNNTFGSSCSSNIFGNNCSNNTFGSSCRNNTFGNVFQNNTFGTYCSYNSFGNDCQRNVLGDWCQANLFKNDVQYVKIGTYCSYNTFGNHCYYINFGTSSAQISYCRAITTEDRCGYFNLTASSGSDYDDLRYVHICLGVMGSSALNPLTLSVARNNSFETTYKSANSTEIIL